MERKPIKTLSLFTGAGGLDIGFHAAGFDIVACVEIVSNYCKTLEANRGPKKTFSASTQILCEDVRKFEAKDFARKGIACLIGGPPCQTFSAAGRRSGGVLGTADARGRLFNAYCDILRIIKPKVFVFENVYGLPGANNGGPWREIVHAFASVGYKLRADVLDAADYGVPQHRERLIMVGYRTGKYEFPMPTHGPDSPDNKPLTSAGMAVADLQDPNEHDHDDLGGLYGHLLPLVPPGLNYAFFTREMGYPEPIFAWRSKFHDFLYKVAPCNPSRTIKAKPGKFTGPFHWKNRHFTVAELKRLQTIPDDFEIVGSYGKVLEQIGNSVPPLLAEVLATSVREQLIDRTPQFTYPIRTPKYVATFRQRQRERSRHFKNIAKRVIDGRFGKTRDRERQEAERRRQTSYVIYNGFFDKAVSREKPKRLVEGKLFKETTCIQDEEIRLRLDRIGGGKTTRRIEIDVAGLDERLPRIKRVLADAKVPDIQDLFCIWRSIEGLLITNSRFLTLIDVYGHYANRGDTVKVRTDIISGSGSAIVRAVRFFGDSTNCGHAIPREVVRTVLGVDNNCELDELIKNLRALRFDIRTQRTHPTMAVGMILCTYPFPLLSAKAHLERRLKGDSFYEPALIAQRSLFD